MRVVSPDASRLDELLRAEGARSTHRAGTTELCLRGIEASRVGEIAAQHNLVLRALETSVAPFEETYLDLTRGELESGAEPVAAEPIHTDFEKWTRT